MKTVIRLAAAASLATASLLAFAPGTAAADDHADRFERERGAPGWSDGRGQPIADGRRDWRDDRDRDEWRHADRHDRGGWERERSLQHQRIRALRVELRRLDDDRAAFHARFGWRNHKKVARYDAWYFAQRASLERELEQLTWYAWR